jgi:2,3-bisphosphoglycerate-dependent phosphoglycerate mutase
MYLYFARHGESEANLIQEFSNRGWKHGLTEKGVLQAQGLAYRLQNKNILRIYTSPLKRAVQTASLAAGILGTAYQIADALREFDTGICEGKRDPEDWQYWKLAMHNWNELGQYDYRIEGGESFNDMHARFFPFVNRLVTEWEKGAGNLLLIGHGALYWCMLPKLLSNLNPERIAGMDFPNSGYVVAEAQAEGLVCLEWCGTAISVQ